MDPVSLVFATAHSSALSSHIIPVLTLSPRSTTIPASLVGLPVVPSDKITNGSLTVKLVVSTTVVVPVTVKLPVIVALPVMLILTNF